ncbi:MAG TPA: hypothetical protein VFZ41_10240 [Solirubrobacterales bacterium]
MSENPVTNADPSAPGFAPGAAGITAPSNPDHHGAPLTEVIAELGFADRDIVANALEATRQTADTPEGYLLESGAIDERQLSVALAERSGLDHVDLDRFEVDPAAVSKVGKSPAARYTALPIAFGTDGALLVAIGDPYNTAALSTIEEMTRSVVRPVIAADTQIRRLIDELPEPPPPAPEPPLPPSQLGPGAEPGSPDRPEPPAAVRPDLVADHNGSESSGGEEVRPGPEDLPVAFATLQEAIRRLESLVDAVERARSQGIERERELEERLNQAQERIAALEEGQAKTATARELANVVTEKLTELRMVLEGTQTA